ncbi:hypothetical protein B0H13DRAFT_2400584 [Mycena leptocephala]|nr:hypothetical protein B0H13DRAFT_2400584 [Mycena leptocephala]
MSSDISEYDAAEVWQVVADARTTNSMILAALTLVAYDHLITFPDEVRVRSDVLFPVLMLNVKVELMWKSRICTTNVVYLWVLPSPPNSSGPQSDSDCIAEPIFHSAYINSRRKWCVVRSLSLAVNITDMNPAGAVQLSPYISNASEAVYSTLVLATVDFVLMLRVWILYGKARWLLYVLIPMISLEILTMGLISHYTIYTTKVFWPLPWPLTGCYPKGVVPRYFTFYSVPVIVVSLTMFIMTVYKCGKTLLTYGNTRMPIYNMFLRDGAFWFVAIFITFIPEVVIWAAARQSLAELMIAPGLAVTSIIGSRVLLNIKALQPAQALPTTTTATTTGLPMGTTIELDTIDYPSRILWATVGTMTESSGATLTVPDPGVP